MVAVVQLVEHQVVILGVAGSSPVSHPEKCPVICRNRLRGILLFGVRPPPPPVILADSAKQSECGIIVGAAALKEACPHFLIPSN